MNNLVSTTEAQNGFYPTPKSVAYQLFDMIDTQPIREVLEPSAGKGDLLKAFGCYKNEKYQESLAEKGVNKKDYNKASCNTPRNLIPIPGYSEPHPSSSYRDSSAH